MFTTPALIESSSSPTPVHSGLDMSLPDSLPKVELQQAASGRRSTFALQMGSFRALFRSGASKELAPHCLSCGGTKLEVTPASGGEMHVTHPLGS